MLNSRYLTLAGLVVLTSCATVTTTKTSGVGIITLPEPRVELNLQFSLKDLEILGDIDVTERFTEGSSRGNPLESKTLVVQLVEITAGRSPFVVAKPGASFLGIPTANSVSDAILAKVLELYPTMDYILFPKVQIETVEHSGIARGGEPDTVEIRLTGKAVRIRF